MRTKFFSKIGTVYISLGIILITTAVGLIIYPQAPFILNLIELNSPEIEVNTLKVEAVDFEIVDESPPQEVDILELPEPLGNISKSLRQIEIPSIGVVSPLDNNVNAEVSLRNGTWLVPDFSTPNLKYLDPSRPPVILAAHRYGYSDWSKEKREKISFYNLPTVKKGDKVNIIWEKRKYTYEITDGDENKFIKKGDFDLVLYTCKLYNSPLRIFRYAKLISINEIRVELL